MEKQNLYRLRDKSFHVRTKAGFKKALRIHLKDVPEENKLKITGAPDKYPCIVRFDYHPLLGTRVNSIPINFYLRRQKQLLEEIQAQHDICVATPEAEEPIDNTPQY